MRVPYKPHSFKKVKKPYRYIIIHDTGKDIQHDSEIFIDTKEYQTGKLRTYNYSITGEADLNYHFIVERIKDDYEVIICRPLNSVCEYDDIIEPFNSDASIHIAVMGDYDFDLPEDRLYKVIAYRILGPLMFMFKLDKSRIKLHREISTNKIECPGQNFEKDRLLSYTKNLVIPR